MREKTKKLMERICTPSIMKDTTQKQLEEALKMLQEEIDINESCNCRTEETETELRKLYDSKCRCRQRLSIIKEG